MADALTPEQQAIVALQTEMQGTRDALTQLTQSHSQLTGEHQALKAAHTALNSAAQTQLNLAAAKIQETEVRLKDLIFKH